MFARHRCGYVFWQLFFIVDSVLYCQENTYQGSVWFCLCVYLLHLQDRTTRMRYLCFVPSLQWTVTFLLRTSSATQRHSLLWRLIILENSGNQGSSSIGKHSPSQIVSLIGLRLVQKPFDTYLRIRIPWHPRLRMPANGQHTKLINKWLFVAVLFAHGARHPRLNENSTRKDSVGKQRRTHATHTHPLTRLMES